MDEMVRFEMTREQALSALAAAELMRDKAASEMGHDDHTTADAASIAMAQFDDVAKLLCLVLFG